MRVNKKMFHIFTIAFVMFVTIIAPFPTAASDDTEIATAILEFPINIKCTIINAEGERLIYENHRFTGDMELFSISGVPDTNLREIEVGKSDSFTYLLEDYLNSEFHITGIGISGNITANHMKSITISANGGEKQVIIDGENMDYNIHIYADNNAETGIDLYGENTSHVRLTDSKSGIVIEGAEGVCRFIAKHYGNHPAVQNLVLYPVSGRVVISNLQKIAKPLKVSGAIALGKKSYDVVSNLRLRNTDDDTSLLVTFSKVKRADGYDIYRYNAKSKKYVKAKTLKGNWNTAWLDKGLVSGKQYKYKVRPWQTVSKKKKTMKMSYDIWAITASETKANVTKIVVDKAKITGKKGQAAKLAATVTTVEGKEVLNGNIRWHSSDKAIATVDKNGKVKLLKKGTCTIWAKTHNGINSKKVTVRVK